ncbi:competence type IV pilus minor pilin ComGE [Mammaliicoccus stepanovicii]|uniref:Prepilin-type N-terminal cleavage/methylation domain-containing protein n=1 Tax=Mammaliicoccus stepanovicii TaxID=643214 RepID=A0A239Z6G0_9STAP|nr:competence type IV pilus minor pilin ComGE [Mammaliicoccus stepanovicii]PNZ72737.1 hypothetical protein CD111_10690 [Mammaliicoccus stepanovicii]GGI39996.1 hypothetical protein GCM10010896_06160 [Mammaliicoccus stepanovicii]SNV66655.1 Uncharacterised protein [Mammaliicoccus stepanovicii]
MLKNNKGFVLIDLLLSILIILLLGGTLLPIVTHLNKTLQRELRNIEMYQMMYQTIQSKDHHLKFDTNKYNLTYPTNKICLEDVINHEKICVQK